MTELILFTTSNCHLCEEAEALLNTLSVQYKINWKSIEISNDDHLINLYGLKIPVVKSNKTHTELNWPFKINELVDLLSN